MESKTIDEITSQRFRKLVKKADKLKISKSKGIGYEYLNMMIRMERPMRDDVLMELMRIASKNESK